MDIKRESLKITCFWVTLTVKTDEFSREEHSGENDLLLSKITTSDSDVHSIFRVIQNQNNKTVLQKSFIWDTIHVSEIRSRFFGSSIVFAFFDFAYFIHMSISQPYTPGKFWAVGRILWDAKRDCPPKHWHFPVVGFTCALRKWCSVYLISSSEKSWIFCLSLKELRFMKKNNENTDSFEKFSDFWLVA